jgi:hypothetical protein
MNNHPNRYCRHATCRTDAATELYWMGMRLDRADLMKAARDALHATVRCRHVPRKGPIRAPFHPKRKS